MDVAFWRYCNLGRETKRPGHWFQNFKSTLNSLPLNIKGHTHNPEFPCLHGKPFQHSSQYSVQENPQLLSSKRETQLWILLKGMHEAIANPQTPQSTIHGQFIALQREEIQIRLPLHRHKFHKALNLDKSLDPSHPQRTVFTIKWSHNPPACRRGTQTTAIETEWNGRETCSWWR